MNSESRTRTAKAGQRAGEAAGDVERRGLSSLQTRSQQPLAADLGWQPESESLALLIIMI